MEPNLAEDLEHARLMEKLSINPEYGKDRRINMQPPDSEKRKKMFDRLDE